MAFEGFKLYPPDISVLFPSRGRPAQLLTVLNFWRSNVSGSVDIEYIVSLDANDPELNNYIQLLSQSNVADQIVISAPPTNVATAMNACARQAKGDLVVCSSDDFLCPKQWDLEVVSNLQQYGQEPVVLLVNDGINPAGHLCTIPIFNRAFYQQWGYVYWEEYPHYCADMDLTDRARLFAKLVVNNDILFEHRHMDIGKAPVDDTYRRAQNRDLGGVDARNILERRRAENFGL